MTIDPTVDRYREVSKEALIEALLSVSPRQRIALDALARGATQTEAAEAAGVTRETVTKWRNHHPEFKAAYAAQCAAIVAEEQELTRAIRAKALAAASAALDGADVSLSDSVSVLRLVGFTTPSDTALPTAISLLDDALVQTRHSCPRPASESTDGGLEELMDALSGRGAAREAERIERVTLSRVADASGIDPADFN